MIEQTCQSCKQSLPEEAFSWKDAAHTRLHSICKACRRKTEGILTNAVAPKESEPSVKVYSEVEYARMTEYRNLWRALCLDWMKVHTELVSGGELNDVVLEFLWDNYYLTMEYLFNECPTEEKYSPLNQRLERERSALAQEAIGLRQECRQWKEQSEQNAEAHKKQAEESEGEIELLKKEIELLKVDLAAKQKPEPQEEAKQPAAAPPAPAKPLPVIEANKEALPLPQPKSGELSDRLEAAQGAYLQLFQEQKPITADFEASLTVTYKIGQSELKQIRDIALSKFNHPLWQQNQSRRTTRR